VYVPEVDRFTTAGETKKWVTESFCCIRTRLGYTSDEKADIWWPARNEKALLNELTDRLENGGIPFLEKYSTREKLLCDQIKIAEEASNPGHAKFVRELAKNMGFVFL
jgi:hypothetical protein